MIKPYLKDRLSLPLCGTHISMTDSISSEILGAIGFDFVWIDTEHSENNYTTLRNHITAVNAGGSAAVVRVSMRDNNHLKRVLEMGPDGIVFPMINTAEEADAAMRCTLYPPDGSRGFGPLRAVRYGLDDIDDYIRRESRMLCRFVQIETETAVCNLPEMLKNPYIDGFIFGPCDLSGSIGELNNVFGERTQALIRRAISLIQPTGKMIGVSTGSFDPKVTGFWYRLGINFVSSGTDYDYILQTARQNCAALREIMQTK